MVKTSLFNITANKPINQKGDVFEMKVAGDTSPIRKSGQFINISVPSKYLRRPISICDYDGGSITLIYKVVGEGTKIMSEMGIGEQLDCMTALGNGFDEKKAEGKIALIGGGVGLPPLFNLAKKLKAAGKEFTVIMGFNGSGDVFYKREFEELSEVRLATADGTAGKKGFVTDLIAENEFDYYFACGPLPMLNALKKLPVKGQLSFESRMGCGFGACMGCSMMTKGGAKQICVDGPVFLSEELL